MLKFSATTGRVVVDPLSLMIGEFKEIWNSDRTPTKEKATRILTYIHLISQIDSDAPFAQAPFSEVGLLAAANTWPDEKNRLPAVVRWLSIYYKTPRVVEIYRKAFETPDHRSERIFNKKIDQLQDLLDKTEPLISKNSEKGKITFTSNTVILTKIMTELSKLMDTRDALQAKIKRRTDEQHQMMGSKKESLLEKKHRSDER